MNGSSKREDETWHRLREWAKGSHSAERLAGHLLSSDGYDSLDPSHPLGGPDGLKDALCQKNGDKWIGAVYFPRGQKSFTKTKKKFIDDFAGVEENNADGIAFVTNQELSLSEREELSSYADKADIFHLERNAHLLDRPENYGVRLQYLNVGMSKEEQLAYMSSHDRLIQDMYRRLKEQSESAGAQDMPSEVTPMMLGSATNRFEQRLGLKLNPVNFPNPKSIHRCTYCDYGYIVDNPATARADRFSALETYLPAPQAVKCPKCGNVDRY